MLSPHKHEAPRHWFPTDTIRCSCLSEGGACTVAAMKWHSHARSHTHQRTYTQGTAPRYHDSGLQPVQLSRRQAELLPLAGFHGHHAACDAVCVCLTCITEITIVARKEHALGRPACIALSWKESVRVEGYPLDASGAASLVPEGLRRRRHNGLRHADGGQHIHLQRSAAIDTFRRSAHRRLEPQDWPARDIATASISRPLML